MTINFYEKNAEVYAALTVTADMSRAYEKFLAYLPHGAGLLDAGLGAPDSVHGERASIQILDAGCGSGRDSLFFMRQGYRVKKCAREHLNSPEIGHRLYREGLGTDEFTQKLREVVYLIYLSAKTCGFKSWECPVESRAFPEDAEALFKVAERK